MVLLAASGSPVTGPAGHSRPIGNVIAAAPQIGEARNGGLVVAVHAAISGRSRGNGPPSVKVPVVPVKSR